jgi:hypothetical protein
MKYIRLKEDAGAQPLDGFVGVHDAAWGSHRIFPGRNQYEFFFGINIIPDILD